MCKKGFIHSVFLSLKEKVVQLQDRDGKVLKREGFTDPMDGYVRACELAQAHKVDILMSVQEVIVEPFLKEKMV